MKPCHAAIFVALCVLGPWQVPDAAGAEPSRGRRILLERGLQIQALTFPHPSAVNVGRWQNANFTTLNLWNWGTRGTLQSFPTGTPWSRVFEDNWEQIPTEYPGYIKDMVSLQYWDELPPTAEFLSGASSTLATWRNRYPNTLGYANFAVGQLDGSSMRNYLQTVQPDMLMFDYYPSFYPSNVSYWNTWYSNMQTFRTAALAGIDGTGQKPLPYAQYLEMYRTSYTAPFVSALPSESCVRLQQNASWAFGYTFVSAFVYNDPRYTGVCSAMFSSAGDSSPTPAFDYVAETNRQSRNLGPALVRLVSTDIRMIPGTYATTPDGIAEWAPGAGGDHYITAITPLGKDNGASHIHSTALIGYFQPLLPDNSGCTFVDGLHFMIVNGAIGNPISVDANGTPNAALMAAGSAAANAEKYHLTFDFTGSDFDSLVRLSRDTGEVELVSLTHYGIAQARTYYLDLVLDGGTGDLFRFWDSTEPLPTLPEPGTLVLLAWALGAGLFYVRRRRRIARIANRGEEMPCPN